MIYLVTAHNKLKQISTLNQTKHLKSDFWESVLELTKYKTVLLSTDIFKLLNETAIPNRTNVLFRSHNKQSKPIPNVIENGNVKEIISTFKNSKDDLYILCTDKTILEYFIKAGDFLIDYTTDELEPTDVSIFDAINFADYSLLTLREYDKLIIRYFVREQANYIGN
ncbi:MAG: hypothetical protein MJ223_03070 [Mycoplasmoidaceae bacterium]|nr:hypothetical protein [Mycoplasmoidaceae bacterium]